jgi:hypothetical protein
MKYFEEISFVFSFSKLIQNFIDRGRRDRGRGPDPLGHELHVGQGGRLGQTMGTGGLAPVRVVDGLKSIVIF